jgi:preprotein translocase subunit YajC
VEGLGPLLLIAIPLLLLLWLSSRQRKQQRDVVALQNRLTPGQEVMTAGGLFAIIVTVDGDVITLETSPGVRSRWDRRAVVKIVTGPAGEMLDDDSGAAADADDHTDGPPQDGPDTPPRPAGT